MAVSNQTLSSEEIHLVTEKAVISEIQRVYLTYFKNSKMSILMFSQHSKIKFNWVRYHFGRWSIATKQAGIDKMPGFKIKEPDEIISEIQQVYFKYYENSIMTVEMFNRYSSIKPNHIQKYFKSWNNALTLAGLNYYQDLKTITPDKIIAEIKRVYVAHFEIGYMSHKKFIRHATVSLKKVLQCYGTWTYALKQAGLISSPHFDTANADKVISELQRVYFTHFDNRYMMFIDFQQYSKVSYYQLCKHFDSWDNALTQAGVCNSKDMSATHKNEIIKEIQSVYKEHFDNTLMTFKGFKKYSNTWAGYIYKHFDSWDNAVRKAGINVQDAKSTNKKEIIAEIKKVYLENFEKSYITFSRFSQHSSLTISKIARHFDTWENALKQAGINYSADIHTVRSQEVITEIRRVYFTHFENKLMTFKALKQFSKLSLQSVAKYFGSWDNAVVMAEVNSRFFPTVVAKEILIQLNRVYTEHYQNTYMTFDKCNQYYTISMSPIRKHFNTWANALKQANAYYSPDLIAINTEAIRKEVRKVYLEHYQNNYMTFPKFKQHSTLSFSKIRIYFGTWENALTESNSLYTQNAQDLEYLKNYNINEIIIELKQVYTEHYQNRNMSLKNFRLHSNISSFKIYKYLKTWDNALKQADIDYIDITVLETRGEKVQNILDDLHRIKVIKKGVFFNFVIENVFDRDFLGHIVGINENNVEPLISIVVYESSPTPHCLGH